MQAEADIVLGQEDRRDPGVRLRLMPRQPQEFRRREPGHGRRARDLSGIGRGGEHVGAFGGRPRVVPQDDGADRGMVRVQQDGAVHLPRQADGAHLPEQRGVERADRLAGRLPPRGALLLTGAVERVRDIEGGRGRRRDLPPGAQETDLHGGGAEVDAEMHGACLPARDGPRRHGLRHRDVAGCGVTAAKPHGPPVARKIFTRVMF
jgi:hypothetical protein